MTLEEGKEYLTCGYCGDLYFPEATADGVRVLGEHSDLCCPVCRVNLAHAAVAGERVLYCERCRGLLVEVDVFIALVAALAARSANRGEAARRTDPRELERRLDCPRCHERMDTHPYGGPGNIVIDNCAGCELNWLDYGELQRVGRAAAELAAEPV